MSKSELTAEEILNINDSTPKPIYVPEWGEKIYIRALRASETLMMADLKQKFIDGSPEIMAEVVTLGVCDREGNLLFTKEHIPILANKAMGPMQRIANEILHYNGFTQEAQEEIQGE